MQSVFLSYSSQNKAVVTRAGEDMKRARVGDVWRYEADSKYGADFRIEYLERIRCSQYFILFDSSHARTSQYVQEEVATCRRTPGLVFLVCLSERTGSWRDQQLFEGQNQLRYFDFLNYESGIRDLCAHFQCSYVPRFTMPRDTDFLEELDTVLELLPPRRQIILDHYEFFRAAFAHDPTVAEAQLLVLIRRELESITSPLVSPWLALGALRSEAKRHDAAEQAFADACRRAPADPRGWAGKGAALFGLGRYREAANAWITCLDCIARSRSEIHRQFTGEIRHNAAAALLAAGDPNAAWDRLSPSLSGKNPCIEEFILAAKILLAIGNKLGALQMLGKASEWAMEQEIIEPQMFIDLIDCLRSIGAHHQIGPVISSAQALYPHDAHISRQAAIYCVELGNRADAIAHYERALQLDPYDLRCRAELAMLFKHEFRHDRCRDLVAECLAATSLSPTDEYYLGLAHFLDGREETARFYHSRSRRSAACDAWPYYDELVN